MRIDTTNLRSFNFQHELILLQRFADPASVTRLFERRQQFLLCRLVVTRHGLGVSIQARIGQLHFREWSKEVVPTDCWTAWTWHSCITWTWSRTRAFRFECWWRPTYCRLPSRCRRNLEPSAVSEPLDWWWCLEPVDSIGSRRARHRRDSDGRRAPSTYVRCGRSFQLLRCWNKLAPGSGSVKHLDRNKR